MIFFPPQVFWGRGPLSQVKAQVGFPNSPNREDGCQLRALHLPTLILHLTAAWAPHLLLTSFLSLGISWTWEEWLPWKTTEAFVSSKRESEFLSLQLAGFRPHCSWSLQGGVDVWSVGMQIYSPTYCVEELSGGPVGKSVLPSLSLWLHWTPYSHPIRVSPTAP